MHPHAVSDGPGNSAAMDDILTEQKAIETQIDAAARRGHVADALPISLLVIQKAELAERRRLLGQTDQQLQASLRCLDALCPAPPEPAPEPLPEARPRAFPRVGDWFPRGDAGLP